MRGKGRIVENSALGGDVMAAGTHARADILDQIETFGCHIERIVATLNLANDGLYHDLEGVAALDTRIRDKMITKCFALEVAIDLLRAKDRELQDIIRDMLGRSGGQASCA